MERTSAIEKRFTAEELADLLTRAATHLVARCRSEYCDPAPPEKFCFVSRSTSDSSGLTSVELLTAAEAVHDLVRPDGSFRDWINLTPVAVTAETTVFEIDYPERFTTRLLVGELAFPFEPFLLLGPTLPPDWEQDSPIPKVALPLVAR